MGVAYQRAIKTASRMAALFQLVHFVRRVRKPAHNAAKAPAGISNKPNTLDVGIIHAIKLPIITAKAPIQGPRRIPAKGYNGTENSISPD